MSMHQFIKLSSLIFQVFQPFERKGKLSNYKYNRYGKYKRKPIRLRYICIDLGTRKY